MTVTVTRVPPWRPNSREGREPCSGQVSEQLRKWSERQGRRPRCSFRASYVVNGAKLCERHAGKLLLELLVAAEEPCGFCGGERVSGVCQNRICPGLREQQ